MAHRLVQTFEFDANARTVYEFFMGPESARPRDVELTERGNNFVFACRFLESSHPTALYSITLGVWLHDATGYRWANKEDVRAWWDASEWSEKEYDFVIAKGLFREVNSFYLVWDREPATITLHQERPGFCVGKLWLEESPEGWGQGDLRTSILPLSVGQRFVTTLWAEEVARWCAEQTAPEAKAVAEMMQPEGEAEGEGVPKSKQGQQGGTLDRVKEARELFEGGMPKTAACKKAHVDPRTYDRYVDQFVDWGADLDE